MKRILAALTAGVLITLAVSLYNCNPPQAYAAGFKINFDSTLLIDSNRIVEGVWQHPIGPDTAVISWGVWVDSVGGTFGEQGRAEVPYNQINSVIIKVEEGHWQFHIYPKHRPASSRYLLWESWAVYNINQNKVLSFSAVTDYFLVLLDTVNTWDFNTGRVSQGYQYNYYLAEPGDYFPDYNMDYYCGTRGVDSTRFVLNIKPRKGTIYAVKCLQSFNINFNIQILGVMDSVLWTFHKR